jgi:hypothetical protein
MGLETILLTTLIATTAASAYIGYTGNKKAAKAATAIGEANAQLDLQQAQVTVDQSQADAQAVRDRNTRLRASQQTTFLKSGLTLDSGTAQDVIYDSSIAGELEALNILYKGNVSAGFSRKQAAISRYEGASRSDAYKSAATGSILSGIGQGLSIMTNPRFSDKGGG